MSPKHDSYPYATADANRRIAQDLTRRRPGPITVLAKLVFGLLLITFFLGAGGFLHFMSDIPRTAPATEPSAEGIVVLTGGDERIAEGIRLLEIGNGKRLLISGVHPDTTMEKLRSIWGPSHTMVFDCCIDIDHAALNTIGNAAEAAKWARARGFSSLTLVTAAYHIPRTLVEAHNAMPQTELYTLPVFPTSLDIDHWWRDGPTLRLLLLEYSKYIVTLLRHGLS